MFDFSFGELLVVAVVGLVVLGPKEFPVVLRYLRGMMRSIRETSDALKQQMDEMLDMDEVRSATRFIKGEDGKLYQSFGLPTTLSTENTLIEPSLEAFDKTHSAPHDTPHVPSPPPQ